MRFKTVTRSVTSLVLIFAVGSTAVAGGRRPVVYMTPQANRGFTPIQEFPHDDALLELQSRATTGARGLQPSTLSGIENSLSRMEQRNNLVVTRDFRSDRAGNDRAGVLAAAQIAATVLGIIKQIEASPTQQTGVQKADALVQALIPLLGQLSALNQNNAAVQPAPAPAVNEPAVAAEAAPLVKLTASLAAVKAALQEYEADLEKQKKLQEAEQAKQKELHDALKAALETVAKKIKDAAK